MASLRLWHSYLSVFVAPSVIFFALTGALQIFNLHEAHDGYQPPVLIEKLARVHKDQVFEQEHRREPLPPAEAPKAPDASPPPPHEDGDDDEGGASTLVLKWFFLFVAVVLATSTTLGLWIALTHITRKRLSVLLLVAGMLIPVVVLLL
jgi:hypothetical protein